MVFGLEPTREFEEKPEYGTQDRRIHRGQEPESPQNGNAEALNNR